MPTERQLDPRHGTHDPLSGTPARIRPSVRRTSSIDCLRLEGMDGPVTVRAAVRDLVTRSDGSPETTDTRTLTAEVDYLGGYLLTAITADPVEPRLADLLGRRVSSGFRAAASDVLPDQVAAGTPLNLLVDDLPGAVLVSGGAVHRAGAARRPAGPVLQSTDLCSGWRAGGTIVLELQRSGSAPSVTGPVAGDLDRDDDPLAWHPMDPLPPHATRRRRRLDLFRSPQGELLVDVYFRDSHVLADLTETSVHEYVVRAAVDPVSLVVTRAESVAHALPWQECNTAPLSARDIEGRTVGELRTWVRAQMTGIRTCTHLNDTLRSLQDVPALLPLLEPVA